MTQENGDEAKERDFFGTVFNSIGDAVVVINRDMRIVMANKAYWEQEKLPVNSVLGRHCYEVSHGFQRPCPEIKPECECPVKETFETGEPSKAVHTHKDKDGNEVYVSIRSYPIKNSSGEVTEIVEILNDITERKNTNDELGKKVKELEDFYEMAVGREMKMTELKYEIEKLKQELKRLKGEK
ncbi:MAG: PAS domain-containing protein [Nitrospirae bacterium]|nr:PAS domain-containing protein [Nitrospirota bacterium]